ncbi:unnamed protein product (macronuclear) [Paramecium tetraurelia]|uniref:PX domain-containing protein n=1 Tax=Paramecium tetraurelia TaxID=5888 RepID=A0E7V7_PARTE|nr:uncharacterized protein GSPATT00024102001 [Paramecium tetraurelia]CAK91374.1 unnamed protein product [Paramecium tetraurelia]|eukprot:XP_001458771.1 hypothetical protein (macronuclear) [Paramecium tetraurelia strain d4-2]
MDKNSFVIQMDSFIENTIQAEGYNKTEFLQYLNSKKINGDQIELWNMDEMLIAREEFLAWKQQNESTQHPQQPLTQYANIHQNPTIDVVQRSKVYSGQQIQINQNSFLYKNPNIEVKIDNYQEQPGSLFSKSYIIYKITLNPHNYVIERRYSQFEKLREYLLSNYPDFYVPPIPEKMASGSKNHIADYRSLALEKFMNTIIRQFWFDELVDTFFSCQNESDLQNKLKQQKQKQREYNISNLTSLDGKIECKISSQMESFFAYQSKMFSKDMEYNNNIRQISQNIAGLYKQLSQEYKSLADKFLIYQQRNKNQNEQLFEQVDDSYCKNLSQMFMTCSKNQEEIGSLVTKHVDYSYAYQTQVLETLREKIKQRDVMRDESFKLLQKIDSQIDKQFKQLSAGQIQQRVQGQGVLTEKQLKQNLFPAESKQFEIIQDNFGYVNNNIYQQIQIVMNMNQYQIIESILNMQQKISQMYQNMVKENEQLFGRY